jgi:dTDP-4-dehydrorhamnose reductase
VDSKALQEVSNKKNKKVQKILIIGGSGFVGSRLVLALASSGYATAYTYSNHQLANLVSMASAYQVTIGKSAIQLEQCIADFQPQIVIYGAVPLPQQEYSLHTAVSIAGVRQTLAALQQYSPNALFVYISTNAVFGNGRGLYTEFEKPDPQVRQDSYRDYAITKAAGEQLALTTWPNTIVARTSMVDGFTVDGFLATNVGNKNNNLDLSKRVNPRLGVLLEKLAAGESFERFSNRYISPTLIDNLLAALLEVIHPAFTYRGVLHLTGSERLSDYEYACQLAHALGYNQNLVRPSRLEGNPNTRLNPADTSLSVAFTQSLLKSTPLLDVATQLETLLALVLGSWESGKANSQNS